MTKGQPASLFEWMARIGYVSRGVLQQQSYGSWLLGLAALGFLAFGLFNIVEAARRRIAPVEPATAAPPLPKRFAGRA